MFDLMPIGKNDNSLFRSLEQLERSLFENAWSGFSPFCTDIIEKEDHYRLQAELPGMNKEDISIQADGNTLTIQARHDDICEESNEQFVRKERRFGSFSREFRIPDVACDQITASYQNGILELILPKKSPAEQITNRIQIK